MTLTLATSIASYRALSELDKNNQALGKVTERLSTGLRINSAADDAAGLALSETLDVQQRVSSQARRNADDAVGALATVDAALGVMKGLLERTKELTVQAESTSMTFSQRAALDEEADALIQEFNRVYASVEFNDQSQLGVDQASVAIQLGETAASFTLADELERNIGTGSFSSISTLGTVGDSAAILVDVDGDGLLDAIVGESTGSTGAEGEVYTQTADGGFTVSDTLVSGSGLDVYDLAVGDIDGDGDLDIISSSDNGYIEVYEGKGTGTFSATGTDQIYSSGQPVRSLELFDADGDGDLDILGDSNGSLFISTNDGAGNFSFETIPAISSVADYDIGDIDGDGDIDIVTTSNANNIVSVYQNDGAGNYSFKTSTTSGSGKGGIVTVGDVNDDGYADIVGQASTTLTVALSNGDGTFGTGVEYTSAGSGTSGENFDLADIDNDGYLDIITTQTSSKFLGINFNNGDGTYGSRETTFVTQGSGGSLAFGDIDGDGATDMLEAYNDLSLVYYAETSQAIDLPNLDLFTTSGAAASTTVVQSAINRVEAEQANVGAQLSRFETASNQLQTLSTDLEAAVGQIRDADTASDVAELTKRNILNDAITAVLAQANLIPGIALSLLQRSE